MRTCLYLGRPSRVQARYFGAQLTVEVIGLLEFTKLGLQPRPAPCGIDIAGRHTHRKVALLDLESHALSGAAASAVGDSRHQSVVFFAREWTLRIVHRPDEGLPQP